jgi:SAM-dependent methyltransferase
VTGFDGRTYQERFDALAAQGVDVHGEATLVRSFDPSSVLDAGCGTGRVAIELARHGIAVAGVDRDSSMIAEARRRAPGIEWIEADLSTMDLGRTFDLVVLAGNVPIFCPEAARADLVTRCAAHVDAGGFMIAGFQLGRGYDLAEFDRSATGAGLVLRERWSTWDRVPYRPTGAYAVSVFEIPGP